MPRFDVTVFNVAADEPGGTNVIVSLVGTSALAVSSAVATSQPSSPVDVTLVGAAAVASGGLVPIEQIAQRFWVNGVTGSDGNIGNQLNPWRTLSKPAPLSADTGGHIDILVAAGTYNTSASVNNVINPNNNGIDSARMIRYREDPDNPGVALMTASGPLLLNALLTGNNYIMVDSNFHIDGSPYQSISNLSSAIEKGINTSSTDVGNIIRASVTKTTGFRSNDLAGTNCMYQDATIQTIGSPEVSIAESVAQPDVADGLTISGSGNLVENVIGQACGHYQLNCEGDNTITTWGRHIIRHYMGTLNWDSAGVFSTIDGSSLGNHGVVLNGNGKTFPPTENCIEDFILKGARHHITDNSNPRTHSTSKTLDTSCDRSLVRQGFFLDGNDMAILNMSRVGTGFVGIDGRIAHCVFDTFDGAGIVVQTQGTSPNNSGQQIKNCIFLNLAQTGLHNANVYLYFNTASQPGGALAGVVVSGNLFPSGALIRVAGIKTDTVAGWEASHPTNFFDNVTGTAAFTSRNLNSTFANVYTNYSLTGGSPGLDQGVDLTQASSGKSNSTLLDVDDASWFIDNRGLPDSRFGPYAGGPYQVMIGADQRGIVNVNLSTNRIILDAPLTWTNNEQINYPWTGSAPNIGAVQ